MTVEYLQEEYNHAFEIIQQAIENIEDEYWNKINEDWSYPFRLFHIIETIDFYFDSDYEEFIDGHYFEMNRKKMEKTEYIRKLSEKSLHDFQKYLDEIKVKVNDYLSNVSDQDLQQKDKFSEWGFKSINHKLSYFLRINGLKPLIW